jgi:PAS domain S-box-containing protein
MRNEPLRAFARGARARAYDGGSTPTWGLGSGRVAVNKELIRIFDAIPSLAWTVLPDGCADLINHSWCEYTGLSVEEASGDGWRTVIHEDDLPHLLSGWHTLMDSRSPASLEVRMRHHDGDYRWFVLQMNPLTDAVGCVVKWCGVCTDIDDRKRSEETFRTVERNLRSIIDTIPALVWSLRNDGSAEFFNQHYLDYVGLPANRASDWGWTDAIHPHDIVDMLASWRRIMASRRPGETEARMRRRDGQFRWMLFRINPLRNDYGHIIRWYGISIDIDDRKRTEERLRRSEAFLAEGQRASLTGSFSWRMDTNELTFSEELHRIFAFEPGQPLTPERIAARVHPDDVLMFAERMGAARHSNADLDYDMRLLMPDGSIKHVHMVSHSTRGRSDHRELIGAIQDVTQRRVADEALGNLRAELARMSKINSLGALTASIAHEVNQPLSGVITNASTCLRMLSAGPPNVDGAIETARRTIRDGHRAADVITRVRALFSKKAAATEPVNLNEATRDVVALSQNTLKTARVILKTDFPDDLPLVMGDRVQLQQVILNLLLNASEAMSNVDDRPRHMTISTARDGAQKVCLTVQDAGVGFEPDGVSKIFDTFYTTKDGGMGIGLSISQSIIERHHGRLSARPNHGPGATFWFSIPCVTDDVADNAISDASKPAAHV